jgi:cytoskeletal protein RodZ
MADIGTTLREARMRAHIDISEVESATKIRAKYLRAIENEEWDLLPGTVYVKSFLRTYGDFLGLDSRLLIDEFKRRYERPTDHEVRQVAGIRRERERSPRSRARASFWSSPRVVIAGAVLVIVVALWVYGTASSNNTSGGRVTTPSGPAKHRHKRSGKRSSRSSSTNASSTTRTLSTTTTPVVATKATLQLVATGDVWVCIVGPGNRPLIPGLVYQAGQKIPEQSATKLLVRLGNDNVTATVDGRAYVIKRSSSAIGLKITAAGASPLASPPTCSA